MENHKITRRKLIKNTAKATLAGSFYLNNPVNLFAKSTTNKSKVVLIRHKAATAGYGKVNGDIVSEMLDEAVIQLTGKESVTNAWKSIVNPDDVVGIKTNVWTHLPTPSALEQSIKRHVMETGVNENNIGIRDRGLVRDKMFQNATSLINIRPARTHHWSGVGTLIKNYIMFVSDPWAYHGDSCADLAKIWKDQKLDKKTKLNVLVMLTPLFHGIGPHHFNRNYVWEYNGLLVGYDPVAVDAVGVEILQARRKAFFGEERPLNPPPKHIYLAETRHRLGTANLDQIEIEKIGWQEDMLI